MLSVLDYLEDHWGDTHHYARQVYLVSPVVQVFREGRLPGQKINGSLCHMATVPFADHQVLVQEFIHLLVLSREFLFLLEPELLRLLLE